MKSDVQSFMDSMMEDSPRNSDSESQVAKGEDSVIQTELQSLKTEGRTQKGIMKCEMGTRDCLKCVDPP
jgi:hypothetical protein